MLRPPDRHGWGGYVSRRRSLVTGLHAEPGVSERTDVRLVRSTGSGAASLGSAAPTGGSRIRRWNE